MCGFSRGPSCACRAVGCLAVDPCLNMPFIISVRFSRDTEKSARNFQRRDFDFAILGFEGLTLERKHARRDYGEGHMVAKGIAQGRRYRSRVNAVLRSYGVAMREQFMRRGTARQKTAQPRAPNSRLTLPATFGPFRGCSDLIGCSGPVTFSTFCRIARASHRSPGPDTPPSGSSGRAPVRQRISGSGSSPPAS